MPAPAPVQGGHYPEPQAGYGYSNQPMLVPQQWGQQHGEPQPYEIAYQQGYNDTDPSPFAQHGGQVQHHQGYADGDMEFDGGYYEDEEPRRGKRWLLIAAALVGAIGVGGALAYTYRSIVAPKSRIAAVKTEQGVKVKVPERTPVKAAEETTPPKVVEPPPQEDPASGSGDGGIRTVRPIIIGPDSGKTSGGPVRVPGITLYTPPEATASPAPSAKEKAIGEVQPSPGKRVKIGSPPPAPVEKEPAETEAAVKEADAETPEPPPSPIRKTTPSQTALVVPRPPPAPKEPAGSGLGFVAVLKSEKSSMDAMKTYADLQQRYPEVLAGKSFDVQEADLSARGLGVMFRVVVGPPGSHNAASGVCARLKAAGYVGCWVKEY